jgi:hypothetical protein
MQNQIPATGAHESPYDKRTVQHGDMQTFAGVPLIKGGYDYLPTEILMQAKVGICTAISLIQNANKAIGRPFSDGFQYLMQKRQDGNWIEGSSIFSALKVGKNIGFLPIELWTFTTEADKELPYAQYIAKLQAVPEATIQNLILKCSDYKLTGYAQVNETDPQAIAKAICDSRAGVLFRFAVGKEWYTAVDGTVTWDPKFINPLRAPQVVISGHAIIGAKFDYTVRPDITLANTWGVPWNMKGWGDIIFNLYRPMECWIPYFGLTEAQTEELKQKLTQQIGIMQKLLALWKLLRGK